MAQQSEFQVKHTITGQILTVSPERWAEMTKRSNNWTRLRSDKSAKSTKPEQPAAPVKKPADPQQSTN